MSLLPRRPVASLYLFVPALLSPSDCTWLMSEWLYLWGVLLGAPEDVGACAVGGDELVHHDVRAEGDEPDQRRLRQQVQHLQARQGKRG